MPGVLDTLVVLLSLDAAPFKKGQAESRVELQKTGDEAEKQRKRLETEQKKVSDAYQGVRDSIMGVAAAIVATVAGADFLGYLTKTDAATGRLAGNLGMATEELSIWEGIFRRMGSSSGEADNMFRGINKILEDLKNTGGSDTLTALGFSQVDIGKFNARTTSMTERVQLLSDALKKMTPQDAQYWGQKMGISEDALNVIIQQRYALSGLITEQKKMNVETEQDKQLAQDREKAWGDFTETLHGNARTLVNEFSPAITWLLKETTKGLLWLEEHIPTTIVLIGALGSALLLLKGYSITSMASAFSGNLGVMGTALGGFLGKLGVLGAVATGGFAFGELLNHFGFGDWVGSTLYDLFNDDPTKSSSGKVAGSGSSGGTRGVRNNNPGNIEFKGQPGASVEKKGRFAKFGSMAEGIAAMDYQLSRYAKSGKDTLSSIINTWSNGAEGNNPAYIAAVSKALGVGANQHLNMSDPNVMRSLMQAMMAQENSGWKANLSDINAGMDMAQRRGGVGSGTMNISMNVYTSASTMSGTGHDAGKAIRNQVLVNQANYGIS